MQVGDTIGDFVVTAVNRVGRPTSAKGPGVMSIGFGTAESFRLWEEEQTKTPQLVVCGGRYTYAWYGDKPLKVGDLVECEGSWVDSSPTWTVTSLETSYDGQCKRVLRRHGSKK